MLIDPHTVAKIVVPTANKEGICYWTVTPSKMAVPSPLSPPAAQGLPKMQTSLKWRLREAQLQWQQQRCGGALPFPDCQVASHP